MKKTTLTLIYSLLILSLSCDKPNDVPRPVPNPVPDPRPDSVLSKKDTLGIGWSQQKVDADLFDIFFQDSLIGYTAGTYLFKTKDGGASWIKVPDASGGHNLFATPDSALHIVTNSLYKKFVNWGQKNTTTALGHGHDLYFISSNIGFLTIDAGLLKTIDGGNKWELVANAAGLQMEGYSGTSFLDSTKGWVFTSSKIFRSNGTITSWSACNLPNNQRGPFSSIHVVSANIIYVASFNGKILKSTDGGQNFIEVASLATPQDPIFIDIFFLDDLHGYVCRDHWIFQTNDGGLTWIKVVSVPDTQIVELHFTDRKHGWACTMDGRVLKFRQ